MAEETTEQMAEPTTAAVATGQETRQATSAGRLAGEPRTVIYGAGSLGTVLGAYLAKAGREVDLVTRNESHVRALNENGATIEGTVSLNVPVKALTPSEMRGTYDVIILLTKQTQNREVVSSLLPHLAEDGVVVTLQNGIPEPSVAEIAGKERTLGCAVEWGAMLVSPGVAELTSDPQSLSFHLGRSADVPKARFDQVVSLLSLMCEVDIEDDLAGARWSKLLVNATFSGFGTVMGGTFGSVTHDRRGKRLAVMCMRECILVGQAAGVTFAPMQGKDITKLFYYEGTAKRMFAEAILPIAMKKHNDIVPSMLQDIRNGKPCEIDAINGVVCEWGDRLGIGTPVNDRIREVIHAIQDGDKEPSPELLDGFADLV